MYISWYGFGRMFIEGLRVDSLYVGSVRISQFVAFVSFVVGTALLVVMLALARRGRFAPTAFMEAAAGGAGSAEDTAIESDADASGSGAGEPEGETAESSTGPDADDESDDNQSSSETAKRKIMTAEGVAQMAKIIDGKSDFDTNSGGVAR
jgi:phosphatidylglycerol:prolipoprotein diacylglycerol transferase